MAEPISDRDRLCLEVLKTIGKTLSQMNLYHPSHPAVKAMLEEGARALSALLAEIPEGELAYTLDAGKVIANGRIVGAVADLPSSIANTFSRFKLNSIIFLRGVSADELSAFCQLAALRPDAAKGVDPAAYLSERSVAGIRLAEALYAKVDQMPEEAPAQGGAGVEAAPAAEPAQEAEPVAEAIEKMADESLEKTIELLAKRAGADSGQCARIRDSVMRRVRAELEARVSEATRELKKQTTVLANEQARTQAVLSNIAEGVVVVDDSGRVLMMNSAAEELYGANLADLAGKPLSEHAREEHLLAMSKETSVPEDKPASGEVAIAAREETKRTLRASTAIVQTESGKPVGMVSALSDAAKFRELQKMQREFVAHVTHELRSPLTAIRAALEILEGELAGKLPPEESRIMMNALKNTDRLEDLVNSILDFSKIESGQMTLYPKPGPPGQLAQEALDSMRPWAMKKGVQLELAAEAVLPTISADPKRTVQVLINLLSNAIKFTPSGGRIRLSVVPAADPAKFVQFSVCDTGPGIAKADQQKIFQKFVQIAAGEKHVGGTGLGLAIAKAFVHLQQGQMWVESDVGKGSTFLFTVPVYVPPPEDAAAKPKPKPRPWWKRLLGYK
ncbi:MAG: PAS domain S-box protein [Elusimicrobia bacterium]|nr:PAS domain S-box protein [Elusimicrobiota bacterium]